MKIRQKQFILNTVDEGRVTLVSFNFQTNHRDKNSIIGMSEITFDSFTTSSRLALALRNFRYFFT